MNNREDFLLVSYMKGVQLTPSQLYKTKRIKLMDKYILQVALISILFLLMKIGAEALVENMLRLK